MSIGSEMNNDVGEKVSDLTKSKKCDIKLAVAPSDLLSKEGFALYIGKGSFAPDGLAWRVPCISTGKRLTGACGKC